MKNLILGIIIGICITSLGVWGYSAFISEDSAGIVHNRRLKPTDNNKVKPGELSRECLEMNRKEKS